MRGKAFRRIENSISQTSLTHSLTPLVVAHRRLFLHSCPTPPFYLLSRNYSASRAYFQSAPRLITRTHTHTQTDTHCHVHASAAAASAAKDGLLVFTRSPQKKAFFTKFPASRLLPSLKQDRSVEEHTRRQQAMESERRDEMGAHTRRE